MAAGRATTWLLLAAPGVIVVLLAAWELLPSIEPEETPAVAPPEPVADAPPPSEAPKAAEAQTPAADATDARCVAPPCEDWVPAAEFSYWRAGDALRDAAVAGRVVDSNGRPVEGRPPLRFWSAESVLKTCARDGGAFVLATPSPGVEYDVDAVLPSAEFPVRRDGRFHVGTVRAGDRDVVLRLPVAFTVFATGTLVDESGRALPRWRVVAHREADGVSAPDPFAQAVTDGEGRFTLEAWTRSEFTFAIRTPAGGLRRTARTELVAGTADVRVTAGAPMIGGAVTADLGASPAGAIVRLRDIATGAERRTTATRTGGFAFEDVDERSAFELSAELAGQVCLAPQADVTDRSDPRIRLTAVVRLVEGTAADTRGRPLRIAWLRFIATDRTYAFQTLTDLDGRFFSGAARSADFDVFLLAPGPDGRLVPGPKLGRCCGGDRKLQLRVSR